MTALRRTVRSLLRTPMVTAVAIVSLALGMGANAAIFSIFERMVLRPLPVQDPDSLVNLRSPGPKQGSTSSGQAGGVDAVFSYPMFRDLEREQTLVSLAGHRGFHANLAYRGNTLSSEGLFVSGSYFRTLGLTPILGRLLDRRDDETPGAHPVAVLSYSYWSDRFGADPAVLNDTLVVNGQPMTVVGVTPRGFRGTTLGNNPRIFVPLSMREVLVPGFEGLDNRRNYWIYVFGRLEDFEAGVSMDRAAAALTVPYQAILSEVEAPLQEGMSDETLARFRQKEIVLDAGAHGQSSIHEEALAPILVLFSVTGVVLLIACVNIANLLLTRATDRAGEIALRLAIGARRHQLIGQLLLESLLLSIAGALVGLFVAHATLRWITSLLPADDGTPPFGFELGLPVGLFLIGLTLLTTLLGLLPAWYSTRQDLIAVIRNQSSQTTRTGTGFVRAAMGSLQIAISLTLLITAGLLAKSLYNVNRVDLGLDMEQLATFGIAPELNGYSPAEARGLFERLEGELAAIPGVSLATASMVPMVTGSSWGSNVTVQGYSTDPDADTLANYNAIGLDYFRTLGIPLIRGRTFEARDALGTPKVAVVNEAFARKFDIEENTVGSRMQVGSGGELDIEIVGLVQDAKYSNVKDDVPPQFFLPYRQNERLGSINFYVRSDGDPTQLLPQIRETVSRLDANLPIENLSSMEVQVRENLTLDRVLSLLSSAFASLATLLAAIGLYGVVAYAVSRRTREIGLRIALGADALKVRRLVFRQVATMAVPGAILGLALATGVGVAMKSLLFELEGHDPLTFAGATLVVMLVAAAAGLVPAQRAAHVDPLEALRIE